MMDRFLVALFILSTFSTSLGLRCWECSEASNEAECQAKGKLRECMFNQDACEIELRRHEGWGGHPYLYKHCKQSRACDNNHVQNPRAAWVPSQCNLDDVNSVCRCCCYQDECNVARDACFARRGCSAQPARIAHGSVSCSNGFDVGSVCTVSCSSYAQLSGSATTTCMSGGSWSHLLAQCLYRQCEPRNMLSNGWYICSNGYNSGSQCTAMCRPGYTLVGAKISTCMGASLRWSSFPPRCRGLQCPDKGTVEGGIVACSDESNLQSRCNVTCEGNRRLEGIPTRYCQDNGTWSHDLPVCASVECPERGFIQNGQVSCTNGVEVDSSCRATCDLGYGLQGLAESTCLPTGYWNSPLPRCSRITCPPLGRLVGGTYTCTDGTYVSSVCTSVCSDKTTLIGSQVTECQADGTWTAPLPECQVILCPQRDTFENGVLKCKDRRVGDKCVAMCDSDRRMVGVSQSICQPNGEWSDPLPTCEEHLCKYGCRFRCDDGYSLFGAPYITCKRNGRWTTRMPECRLIVCRGRGRVAQGRVDCTDTNQVGSECAVTCNDGYSIVGSAESVCLPTGRWNVPLPRCRPTCGPGRELIGSILSTCQADASWDAPLPTCRSLPCPDQGDLNHGTVSCNNGLDVGSRCRFNCVDDGYELYPKNARSNTCQRDQTWSIPKPCCTRPCPPYAMMDIVLVLDSSSSIGAENWVKLVSFVEGVIRSFRVAPDLANFALFRYNRVVDTSTQILLNQYPGSVDDVILGLRAIPYDGSGTFTGVALDHALTQSLAVENGNRPDVPDMVLLVTDGKASDDIQTPSDSLRAAGVQILVLGIEPPRGSLDEDQLLTIAGDENNLIIARGGFGGLDSAFIAKLGSFICGEPCT